MQALARRRSLFAALVVAGLAAIALWLRGGEEPHTERATQTSDGSEGVALLPEAPKTEPEPESAFDPAADKEWRLEVEIRDENGAPLKGRVYVTAVTGDLLSALDTAPPAPLTQPVRGTVNVIVYAEDRVPRHFERLAPPSSGARTLVAEVERGPGIEGKLLDDLGQPVTSERAPLLRISAYPLDLPPWLSNESESWRRVWGWVVFWSRPEQDGSFRIDGLPAGRYEIQCDPQHDLFRRGRETEPLLQLEPVVAQVGDTDARIVCVRAVEVRVRLIDFDTGEDLRGRDSVMRYHATDGDLIVASGSGSMRAELPLTVRPGAELVVSVEIEGYLPPEPLNIDVRRDPGKQEATLAFRRDVGGMAVLDLTVLDDVGQPVYPLMVGRPLAGMGREEHHDGRYVVRLPAGDQTVQLQSPSDQRMLFAREWVPSNLDPDDYAGARAYLPANVKIDMPRGGRITREVRMQRTAFVWIRQEPAGSFQGVRVLRGETEIEHAVYELYEDKGLAAQLEPGTYTVEGKAGDKVVRVEVSANAAEVAEVWLRAESAK